MAAVVNALDQKISAGRECILEIPRGLLKVDHAKALILRPAPENYGGESVGGVPPVSNNNSADPS